MLLLNVIPVEKSESRAPQAPCADTAGSYRRPYGPYGWLGPSPKRLPIAACAILLAAPEVDAQGGSGGSQGVVIAHAICAMGGRSIDTAGTLVAGQLGQVAAGEEAISPSYIIQNGVVWVDPTVGTGAPIVFGALPPTVDKDGGDTVTVYGFNFLLPPGGPLSISVAGNPDTGTVVTSNTTATTTVPQGVDALGNPLAFADIAVSNSLGTHTAKNGLIYTPALLQNNPARVGKTLKLQFLAEPGGFMDLGQSLGTGPGVPFLPFDGVVELAQPYTLIVELLPVPSGEEFVQLPVPPLISLIGVTASFQSLAITQLAPLAGAFSNTIQVTIEP